MDRRTFITAVSAAVAWPATSRSGAGEKLSVAVIGHTGRGNYGHGLDTVWLRIPEVEVVAVADADAAGLAAAQRRLHVERGYGRYEDMLGAVKPDVVAVCARHPDQHCAMTLAAIGHGAKGIYVEKPFCRSPAEADEMIAACQTHDVKLAVAHRNRYHPTLQAIDKLVANGQIGRLLEIRGRGKGDRRGGSEDLWVLGSHVLNLMQYFAGAPQSCSAELRQDGRRVTRADVRDGNEALGPLAGDEVHARYAMQNGVVAYFDSIANDGTRNAGFGLQLIGSEGIIAINCDCDPLAHLVPGNPFQPTNQPRPWIPISTAGPGRPEPRQDLEETVTHHVGPCRDLIAVMGSDRQPLCSVYEAAMTVEMICAAFESHRQGSRAVAFPLKERANPLSVL